MVDFWFISEIKTNFQKRTKKKSCANKAIENSSVKAKLLMWFISIDGDYFKFLFSGAMRSNFLFILSEFKGVSMVKLSGLLYVIHALCNLMGVNF